jgi:tetratricopeptide (TPR) repeat protein
MRSLSLVVVLSACGSSPTGAKETLVVPRPAAPVAMAAPPPEPPEVAPAAQALPLARALRAHLVDATAGSYEQDAVLFRFGCERELAGDRAEARRAFLELIQKSPSSKLVPYAYLAFADLFFEEAASDPTKWELARQAYSKVMTFPPRENPAYAFAVHRRGLVMAETGDHAHALADQKNAIATTLTYPNLPSAAETAEAARRALVTAYAAAGRPELAFTFFHEADADRAPALVVALGEEYLKRGEGQETAKLYDGALDALPSPEICDGAASAARALAAPFGAQIERTRKTRCP